jgi:hypothetical protein
MSSSKPPKDALGNELHEGDLVAFFATQHLIMRVMKIDNGGVQTTQGQTPGIVIVGVTLTIRCLPGGLVPNLARAINPESEAGFKKILEVQG